MSFPRSRLCFYAHFIILRLQEHILHCGYRYTCSMVTLSSSFTMSQQVLFRLALPNLSVVILVFPPVHVSCTTALFAIVFRGLKRTVSSSNFPPSIPPASNISADNNYSSISSTFPVLISLSPLSSSNCAIPFTPNSFRTVCEISILTPSMANGILGILIRNT